jgi:hypothetical protein
LRGEVEKIFELTDAFCAAHLDQEYAALCRRLVAKLAGKRPSPLRRGQPRIWAAGALHVVGANNFLFDPSQTPHLTSDRLSELVGVPKGTIAGKAKGIRDTLALDAMDAEFCRRELLADHPVAWLVEMDGIVIDARVLPVELQVEAASLGLIPDIGLGEAA